MNSLGKLLEYIEENPQMVSNDTWKGIEIKLPRKHWFVPIQRVWIKALGITIGTFFGQEREIFREIDNTELNKVRLFCFDIINKQKEASKKQDEIIGEKILRNVLQEKSENNS